MKKYANIAIILGIAIVLYSFINFSINQLWDWISTISLIIGLGIAGVGVFYRLKFREKALSTRSLQYGANTLLSSVIFLGILILLAFVTSRHHLRADLTEKGLYSLADQTKVVLHDLNKEVNILAFYKKTDQGGARDILDEYSYRSKFVKYQFVDPNEKPQIARQYQVTRYNTVVVESGGKRETLEELNESSLTNAILKVTRELDKVVYFTTGHGEREIDSENPQGYKLAVEGIQKENYLVKKLNLASDKKIPKDCSVLIIAGPKTDFFSFELDSIRKYIDNGGKLMVLLDPEWKPALVEFLKQYKIQVDDDVVVDASGIGQLFGMGPEVPLVSKYENHPIFEEFNVMSFYPFACSVRPIKEGSDESITTQVLFKSSANSWGETDYRNTQVAFNKGKDIKGPVPLAVVATKKIDDKKSGQVLVIGDSDFAMNAYIKSSGNYDLFLNTINWMAEEEDMITIRPKEVDDRRVTLTQKDSKIILYVSVFALPLLIVVGGVLMYFKRR